ncbi:MAG: hypothetical protein WBA93_23415 [Microcoleaceae cyanobacterium]
METIEIHEFSTGIIPEIAPDGKWISKGFKVGEYMNLTLPQVPHSVGRAIANKGFEVGKDRHSQEPTFVGRVVLSLSNGEPDYSVVAVVNSGQDEYGRSTSFYRYFLCAGKDKIWQILDWLNTQQQQGINPIFNPSETREVGKPNIHNLTTKPQSILPVEWQQWLSSQTIPVIIPTELSDLQTINKMAEIKADGQPLSWAYNVEAIERPEQFMIIHPANAEVAASLTQIQTKMMENPQVNISTNIDEAAIETAIKGLISGSKIKSEWVQNLILRLQSGQVKSEYLNNLFDNLGASNAAKQGSANVQMVRLLTLRAIFIPETLPEYLNWLNINGESKKEDEKPKISLQLQSQLINYLNLLEPLIAVGMNRALSQILVRKIPVPAFCWLLKTKGSLWSAYSSRIRQQVRHDLDYIKNALLTTGINPEANDLLCGNAMWKKLISCLKSGRYNCNYYQPFADFFAQLSDYELAAYFYQVGYGEVPKSIFLKAFPKLRSAYEGTVFGLTVSRQVTLADKLLLFTRKYGVAFAATCLLLASHSMIFAFGFNRGRLKTEEIIARQKSQEEIQAALERNNLQASNINSIEISEPEMITALEKFPVTSNVIQEIVNDISMEINSEAAQGKIIGAIKEILVSTDLQYGGAIKGEFAVEENKYLNAQKEWIKAIYLYQQKFFSKGFGFIEPNRQTADRLKCDVADLMEVDLQPRPQRCGEKTTSEYSN